VAFTDDKNCLSIENIIRWFNESKLYCTGSLVRRKSPNVVYCEGRFERVELASANSTINYGTIYIRPDTGFIRTEIKFKDKDKIQYLLEDYSIDNMHKIEHKYLQALVGCIDFVTASSKKKRSPAKYERQESWNEFIGSDIKRINWAEAKRIAESNRVSSNDDKCSTSLKRLGAMIQNAVSKLSPTMSTKKILRELSIYSGYIIKSRN
jgi:hypothetical protein